jgi:hypothetical protein
MAHQGLSKNSAPHHDPWLSLRFS